MGETEMDGGADLDKNQQTLAALMYEPVCGWWAFERQYMDERTIEKKINSDK